MGDCKTTYSSLEPKSHIYPPMIMFLQFRAIPSKNIRLGNSMQYSLKRANLLVGEFQYTVLNVARKFFSKTADEVT